MQALVELIKDDDLKIKATFPRKVEIREIAAHISARVFEQAIEENLKVNLSSRATYIQQLTLVLVDWEQSDAGGLRPGWDGSAEGIYLLQDVVSKLQTFSLCSSGKRRLD